MKSNQTERNICTEKLIFHFSHVRLETTSCPLRKIGRFEAKQWKKNDAVEKLDFLRTHKNHHSFDAHDNRDALELFMFVQKIQKIKGKKCVMQMTSEERSTSKVWSE